MTPEIILSVTSNNVFEILIKSKFSEMPPPLFLKIDLFDLKAELEMEYGEIEGQREIEREFFYLLSLSQ